MAKAKSRKEELLDELIKEYKNPDDLIGENGLLKELTKALVERAMQEELTYHLGYEKSSRNSSTDNSRNGSSRKVIKGDSGNLEIEVPRDRNAQFEPKIIQKNQTRWNGFDDKIISMYSRGMTTRDIQGHLQDMYQVEVSPDLISTVTAGVIDQVKQWQSRPLDPMYPIIYLDALRVKVRDEGQVKNKAVYLAIGVNIEGKKEVLGLWIEKTEGSKFWLQVLTELKNRGLSDILIACVDGLTGFPEAINSVYPNADVQLCIVHMVRNSLKYVSYKFKKEIATDLKKIYRAVSKEEAEYNLDQFSEKWDAKYPMISKSWRNKWEQVIPFLDYPADIRKVIYTTNAIESLNMTLRKVIKNRASFPNDDAVRKLMYLALLNIEKKWTMPIRDWGAALNQFAIKFEGRVEF
jgi:transposase-like protein